MKRILVIIGLLLLASASFGCWKRSANTAETNTNTAVEVSTFTDAAVALAEGTRLFDENQTEMAIAVFQKAIELDPDLAEAHFKLGVAYALLEMQMQQTGMPVPVETAQDGKISAKTKSERAFERAVEAYEKWLKENPDDDVAHFYLGRTYSKLLRDEEAEREFKQAVRLKPDDTEYQTELGAVLIKLANYREAVGPLKKAIELDATNDRAISLLEDAQAGRQRVDYVQKSNSNQANANTAANSNTNANSASNSNSAPSANTKPVTPVRTPANTSTGPPRETPRSRVANPSVNRPNMPN